MDLNFIFNTAIAILSLIIGTVYIRNESFTSLNGINWEGFWIVEILFVLIILKIYLMTTFGDLF